MWMQPMLAVLLLMGAAVAQGQAQLEKVVLQLKWTHQFQFAGYYAAVSQGYYRKAGFDVVLREGRPGLRAEEEVVSGRAQYGVLNSELILLRSQGSPIVAVASIYQHSPLVLAMRMAKGVREPKDLAGKRIMLVPGEESTELFAMLRKIGLAPPDFEMVPHTYDHGATQDLTLSGISLYSIDITPGMLDSQWRILRPIRYGIDFYGDCLFTSKEEVDKNPERVESFRQASLEGWQYAFDHVHEIVNLIVAKYPGRRTRDQLIFEAHDMQGLIMPFTVEIGHMNRERWRRIGKVYKDLGMMDEIPEPEDFIFDPRSTADGFWVRQGAVILGVLLLASILVASWNLMLRNRVRIQTASLQKSEARYRAIVEDQTELICRNRPDGLLTFVNPAYCRYFGRSREELEGTSLLELVREEDKQEVFANLAVFTPEHPVSSHIYQVVAGGGAIRWQQWTNRALLDEEGTIVEIQGCGRDVTDRIEAEHRANLLSAQLLQSQKMEAVGQLAGGIAHDFNNLLTAILGNTELLREELQLKDPEQGDAKSVSLDGIRHAAHRAADLTARLLAFSRKTPMNIEALEPASLIKESRLMMSRLVRENIEMSFEVDSGLPRIRGDRTLLEQCLLNLTLNAQDAMPGGGLLVMRAKAGMASLDGGNGELTECFILEVEDKGEGISTEDLPHLFEPFFTTKEVGKGTGLGLSVVYGVITDLGGRIEVESEGGEGSLFRVFLPALSGQGL
jgi:PAS domain S-box-containing protein